MTSKGVINMGICREGKGLIGKCCPTGTKKEQTLVLLFFLCPLGNYIDNSFKHRSAVESNYKKMVSELDTIFTLGIV